MATTDDTQIYVTGVLYYQDAYPDSPQDLFDIVDEFLRQIDGLSFWVLAINRSETRFSGGTTREQLLIFLKDVIYNEDSYLSDTDSNTLRTTLISKLNSVPNLTYTDVEIRSTRATI